MGEMPKYISLVGECLDLILRYKEKMTICAKYGGAGGASTSLARIDRNAGGTRRSRLNFLISIM